MLYKLSIIISVFLISGCSKDTFNYNKLEAYDDLHESIARYSASIESRNINWDSLGSVYRPIISENMTESEYFEEVSELLKEFRDPHVWLLTPLDSLYTIDHLGYTKNYNAALTDTYLNNIEKHNTQIISAYINDSIGYIFCADFKGDEHTNNEIYTTIINKLSNTKGLIIDLRINDGGSVYNAQNLLNKFADSKTLWHTTQNKTLDGFDEKHEWYIEPDKVATYPNNVVILNGRFTVSAGERFAIGAKLLDNLIILGDTTANTQGSVMGREMLNGWKYTLTFEKCLAPNGVNYGGLGIPPDEFVSYGSSILDNRDYLLERAIEILN